MARNSRWPALAMVASVVLLSSVAAPSFASQQSSAEVVRVGHWLEIRGQLSAPGRFVASKVELVQPQSDEILVGTVSASPTDSERLVLLGQPVLISDKTEWEDIGADEVAGRRVKVEGHFRSAARFAAREIAPRGPGRERIGGRVDMVARTEEGIEVRIMRYTVLIPAALLIDHDAPIDDFALAPSFQVLQDGLRRDEDDELFGRGIALTDSLRLTGHLEFSSALERNYDLDVEDAENRTDYRGSGHVRFEWRLPGSAGVVAELRSGRLFRDDEEDGSFSAQETRLGETFAYLGDVLIAGLDLQLGRQDFDERREWVYDNNLDALRVVKSWSAVRAEVSLSTSFADGRERDRNSTNFIAYVSNRDRRRHLAAYTVYRRIDVGPGEAPVHLGLRAIGEFLPDTNSWLELAHLRGTRGANSINGWGFDVGTTWSPGGGPVSLTVGYAIGTGDDDPSDGVDRMFRQTGFQDNNDKFAGVTSFRYYGELVDPELANLQILTAGVGTLLARRTSLDVVAHQYSQPQPHSFLVDTDLDSRPDGIHKTLGWELDAVVGWRHFEAWDLEAVGGYFLAGPAFRRGDNAYLLKLQLRYRF